MNKSLLKPEALIIAAFLREHLDGFTEHVAEHRDPEVYDDYENEDQNRSYAELLISALSETYDGSKAINAADKPWTHDEDSALLIIYGEVYGIEDDPEQGSGRIIRQMLPPNFDTSTFDEAARKLMKCYIEDVQMEGRPEITGGLVNESYFREHYSHLFRFECDECGWEGEIPEEDNVKTKSGLTYLLQVCPDCGSIGTVTDRKEAQDEAEWEAICAAAKAQLEDDVDEEERDAEDDYDADEDIEEEAYKFDYKSLTTHLYEIVGGNSDEDGDEIEDWLRSDAPDLFADAEELAEQFLSARLLPSNL